MNNKVLITGGTGNTGGHAIKRLLELNIPVRALVRKIDERSDALQRWVWKLQKATLQTWILSAQQ